VGRKQKEWEIRRRKGEKKVEVKKIAEKWKIWDEEKEAARSEEKAKKFIPEKFYQWIKVFGKKQSEKVLMRKV